MGVFAGLNHLKYAKSINPKKMPAISAYQMFVVGASGACSSISTIISQLLRFMNDENIFFSFWSYF
jgi:hypothetical protein